MKSTNKNFIYENLFQPYTLNNGVVIKNRLAVAPMTHLASKEDGSVSDEELAFLDRRATDFGLFITAATLVHPTGKAFVGQPEAINDNQIESLKKVSEKIKSQGAKAILQIHHGGFKSIQDLIHGQQPVSPSKIEGSRALTNEEILEIIDSFGNATKLAIKSGFDGIELHGANGYLLQQFYSKQSNLRKDRWGDRFAFIMAVVDKVVKEKENLNKKDFIIGYRFSPEEPGTDGITMQDTFNLIDELVKKDIQYLHVSLWDFYKKARRGADLSITRIQQIHERIAGKMPLIGVGNLFTGEDVLNAFNTGWAEFIAVGKTVLINPNFATLIANNETDKIATLIDIEKNDFYKIPEILWNMTLSGSMEWLPPVKGKPVNSIDL